MLGKGGSYRSFGKLLEIPGGYFADFADWSRLAMMRNRRTLDELRRLQRDAVDPAPIGRMIALIEHEQGFPLYDAVGRLKRQLSSETHAEFRFSSEGVEIAASMDHALARAALSADAIDRVFLTGGSSLIPAIRAIFRRRFGEERIATGGELTSIAHGLALIGDADNLDQWVV